MDVGGWKKTLRSDASNIPAYQVEREIVMRRDRCPSHSHLNVLIFVEPDFLHLTAVIIIFIPFV